jgi:predicted 3-demethylubiquinone-9 3-methyltransferase (glyoxalase superfamily)
MQKIKTFLWYDNQAEDAANFYTSLVTKTPDLAVT